MSKVKKVKVMTKCPNCGRKLLIMKVTVSFYRLLKDDGVTAILDPHNLWDEYRCYRCDYLLDRDPNFQPVMEKNSWTNINRGVYEDNE